MQTSIMTKVSLIVSILSYSAISTCAFAPVKTPLPDKLSCLDARKIHDNEEEINVGKIFAAAALSLAIFMGPSPALADGEKNDLITLCFIFLFQSSEKSLIASYIRTTLFTLMSSQYTKKVKQKCSSSLPLTWQIRTGVSSAGPKWDKPMLNVTSCTI
jgi:hypothetical protein